LNKISSSNSKAINSYAVILLAGSFFNVLRRNYFDFKETFYGIMVRIPILSINLIKASLFFAGKGSLPVSISKNTTPIDQTSDEKLLFLPSSRTYGAIYKGEPALGTLTYSAFWF